MRRYRAPFTEKPWIDKFKHVIGIIHTNYLVYTRGYTGGAFKEPMLYYVNQGMCRANCHKIIKLSGDLIPYDTICRCCWNCKDSRFPNLNDFVILIIFMIFRMFQEYYRNLQQRKKKSQMFMVRREILNKQLSYRNMLYRSYNISSYSFEI